MTIYKITNENNTVLYVGKTTDLKRRISRHNTNVKNTNNGDYKQVYLYSQLSMEDKLIYTEIVTGDNVTHNTEAYWIKKLAPKFNTQHNTTKYKEWVPMEILLRQEAKQIEEDEYIKEYLNR